MAQIDLRNSVVKIWDGTLPTLVETSGSNANLLFTAVSRHNGSKTITVTIINPATTSSLTVVVDDTGFNITITLAYATGAITSTANSVLAAVNADTTANKLVVVTLDGMSNDGTGLMIAQAKAPLTGQNGLAITVGEGDATYDEHRKMKFTLNRGMIYTVKLDNDEPMDVSLDFIWEELTSVSGAETPTVEEAFKHIGPAADWVTSSDDPCQPYCVDVEIANEPPCDAYPGEIYTMTQFYYESLNHNVKQGMVAVKGRCNSIVANVNRFPLADYVNQ